MNGLHERLYRGYRIAIALARREHEMVHLTITTFSLSMGLPGPAAEYAERFHEATLFNACRQIKSEIDAHLSNHDTDAAFVAPDS
ncbi:hypothetical protein Q8F57_045545 [Paraburkholderia terrae]|uniref:hypothetical protein n=1 Tax=Paraburkholderia terrae TaxID=311230 RepID=UPI00296A976C|nr:hypothetical protein [Paraburkholderia terrae]MDW3660650.1 hypothetical protein [Paraburkholderia terrae]